MGSSASSWRGTADCLTYAPPPALTDSTSFVALIFDIEGCSIGTAALVLEERGQVRTLACERWAEHSRCVGTDLVSVPRASNPGDREAAVRVVPLCAVSGWIARCCADCKAYVAPTMDLAASSGLDLALDSLPSDAEPSTDSQNVASSSVCWLTLVGTDSHRVITANSMRKYRAALTAQITTKPIHIASVQPEALGKSRMTMTSGTSRISRFAAKPLTVRAFIGGLGCFLLNT